MTSPNDVVITGMGVVSPLGTGLDAFWASVQEGRSGVTSLEQFASYPVTFGGEVREFNPKPFVRPRKSLKVMCREIQMAHMVSAMALQHAGIAPGDADPDRFGVVLGSEMFSVPPQELIDVVANCTVDGRFDVSRWGEQMMRDISPLWLLKHLPNMAACHVAIGFDARGPNNTIVLGESSSLLAVMEAASIIRRGWADVMLTGGTGARIPNIWVVFRGDANLSHRNDDPAAASRPFDKSRDGMVNGEGAAAFVLERRERAESRGVKVYGQVLDGGSSFQRQQDGLEPTSLAIRTSITQALTRAKLSPQALSHVNANGLSTVEGDAREAQAIRETMDDVPVTALKSFFGNTGAGTGAVEMVASLLGLNAGQIPPTLNYATPDPDCRINVVREPTPSEKRAALLLNQSGTGQAFALALSAE